ncbi:ribonuclease P protein component [uncultured Algimonas sp.]|uniref:ribonuclease P protein component n=1 Tax=uncultured Algimonas sp. TaxID=1547920 RepID=UPI0026201EFF|nr:ribonuclease P protein component [uncultured Algimonas sp.]
MTISDPAKLGTLRKRSEFLHVRDGDYAARGAVVVQVRANPAHGAVRYGVTATKRIGNAVTRNRAKRRLREIAKALLPELGRPGHDYVLIARDRTPACDWDRLLSDARRALQSLPGPGQSPARKP